MSHIERPGPAHGRIGDAVAELFGRTPDIRRRNRIRVSVGFGVTVPGLVAGGLALAWLDGGTVTSPYHLLWLIAPMICLSLAGRALGTVAANRKRLPPRLLKVDKHHQETGTGTECAEHQ